MQVTYSGNPNKSIVIDSRMVYVKFRDVNTVYFSEPVTGLPKPVFYRLPKGLL